MTAMLSAPVATRLSKLMSLFDSDHEGERAAALDAATRQLQSAGLRWSEIRVMSLDATRHLDRSPPPPPCRRPPSGDWRRTAQLCRLYPQHLSAWEESFVFDLVRWPTASTRQRAKLAEIAMRLRAKGSAV
jgi:hypothetical protein